MPSELTFNATQNFRNKLLVRNLPPYSDAFKPTEFSINDLANSDPGNVEDIGNFEEKKLYLKNKYGPEDGFGDLVNLDDIKLNIEKRNLYYTFIASTYSPFNILTDIVLNGDNGSLSQDSQLAQIGAKELKTQFEYRIQQETYQQTLGRINVLDALSDPFDALAIATGNEQIIESDWKISVPDSLIGKGLDFISRISGIYSPYSWIPGNYFNPVNEQSGINQASSASGFFSEKGTLLPEANRNSSEDFISNTGRGQVKRLFKNLSFNVYAPDYSDNERAFGLTPPSGNFYIGSKDSNPKDIISPPNELPTDQYGNKNRIPVRGYGELGKIYENEYPFKFGLNGNKFLRNGNYTNSSYDAPRLQGGFTWVSFKSINASGRHVSEGGALGTVDSNFESSVKSSWDSTISTQYDLKPGSILDDTQRLINAADNLQGDAKLQHVGNAINQISKVFHDGTREITKGSKVYSYSDSQTGEVRGIEYCRIFTKDVPYFSNSDLQKSDGMVDSNRRFSYSTLNNTYNLNIAPWRDQDSSNLTGNDFSGDGVKKYMFSLENLAWRTSSKPGFTYDDLPNCEKGPNGGRIMWFPPYDIKFNETNSVNWTSNEFLGRPEPIYTYNNTTRTGSLSWKIVVDHPSIMNAIVDKELSGENAQKVNDIVDSFFAGCRKYDIYEMATRFPQFTIKDIYDIITTTKDVTEYQEWSQEFKYPDKVEKEVYVEEYTPEIVEQDYRYEFYFHNDVPGPRTSTAIIASEEYGTSLTNYIAMKNEYLKTANENQKTSVEEFFNTFLLTPDNVNVIEKKTKELSQKIKKAVDKGSTVNITLIGSASAPNNVAYNESLSKRRIDSVKKYLLSFSELSKYEDKINITESALGEVANVTPGGGSFGTYNCNEDFDNPIDSTYSVPAMACRAVIIEGIEEVEKEPQPNDSEPIITEKIIPGETYTQTGVTSNTTQVEETSYQPKREVAKIVVKKLLNECDYFNMMKEDTPFIYEGIKEKIKYFHPVFHSITPEGLNSRLTFLQQCLRPGDTIPVIGEDGKPRQGDIKNTAFGAPPICVLRIGDFYHTKIVIRQISINFEPLQFDLNPEGIGIQPMIADINMSFDFIGGQGMKEPVARLQNALSFNYYANTEVYDDRAVVTEDREELNRQILDQIEEITGFSVKDGQIERTEEAGDTLGEIISTTIGDEYLEGEIIYKSLVNDLVNKTQSYTQNIISSLDTIRTDGSKIMLYYFTNNRNYMSGNITGNLDNIDVLDSNIFGKPTDITDLTNDLFTKSRQDVENDTNPFLSKINNENFKNSDIKKFKKNLKSFIDYSEQFYPATMNSTMYDLLETQTEMVRTIDQINLVLTNTDGFKDKSGRINLLELSATTDVDVSSTQSDTHEEMLSDIQTIGFDIQAFYDVIFEEGGLISPKTNLYEGFLSGTFNTESQTRFCTISYVHIMTDPEEFINTILGDELSQKPEWVSYVNKVVYGKESVPSNLPSILSTDGTQQPILPSQPGLLDIYKDLQKTTTSEFEEFQNSDFVKKFTLYQPFNSEKQRKFTYVQKYQEQADQTKVGYFETTFTGLNGGELDKYNLKYSFN